MANDTEFTVEEQMAFIREQEKIFDKHVSNVKTYLTNSEVIEKVERDAALMKAVNQSLLRLDLLEKMAAEDSQIEVTG